jgi:uncharacterized RDD family membrane protein YckC
MPLFGSRDPASIIIMVVLTYTFSIAVAASYEAVLIAKYAATPGKMALGLNVIRSDGTPIHMGRSFGRHFSKMVSGLILGIGYIMIAFDGEKRGLHDMIVDTRVVKAR